MTFPSKTKHTVKKVQQLHLWDHHRTGHRFHPKCVHKISRQDLKSNRLKNPNLKEQQTNHHKDLRSKALLRLLRH